MDELKSIKALLLKAEHSCLAIEGWVNQKATLRFLDYSYSQLRRLEKNNLIEYKTVGRRKFYSTKSIEQLINNSTTT